MTLKHLLALTLFLGGNAYAMQGPGGANPPQGGAPGANFAAFMGGQPGGAAAGGANPIAQAVEDGLNGFVGPYVAGAKAYLGDKTSGKQSWIMQMVNSAITGKVTFPIKGDDQLGDSFTEDQWTRACAIGDMTIVKHFLATPEYLHLLNQSDEKNRPLSWAAFGYLLGDEIDGITPNLEGFRLLVQAQGGGKQLVNSKFLIGVGLGQVDFDEWLLQDAAYSDDASKQERLDELKALLQPTLSGARVADLKTIKKRKDDERKAKEQLEADKKSAQYNKAAFITGLTLVLGGLYYWLHYSQKNVKAPAKKAVQAN